MGEVAQINLHKKTHNNSQWIRESQWNRESWTQKEATKQSSVDFHIISHMARAFLTLSTELTEAFSAAQDDLQIRALVLSIEEETINLKSVQNVGGDGATDFDGAMTESLSGELSEVLKRSKE